MSEACKVCAFYDAAETKATDTGLCHFNPPAATADKEKRWPVVSADEWCARFENEAK